MRAVAYQSPQPISSASALVDVDLPVPVATGQDLLVEVRAVSVNPVDTKIRKSVAPADGEWKVLGWDAAGVVVATGPDVTAFRPGDEVYYAGAIHRPGTNAQYHLVDERIVGAQAEEPRLQGRSCLAADGDHRLGDALRPA